LEALRFKDLLVEPRLDLDLFGFGQLLMGVIKMAI